MKNFKPYKTKIETLINKIFGDLIVIGEGEAAPTKNGYRRRKLKCKCSCNTIKDYNYHDLVYGHSKSCGCKTAELMKEGKKYIPLAKARYRLYQLYIRNAKKRNYCFELTYEQFEKLTLTNCKYCNIKPNYILPNRNKTEFCTYNGIDRVDNTQGYTLNNVVSCCKICNFAKEQQTLEQFKEWVIRIYNNINK